jgi:hypothetical protein
MKDDERQAWRRAAGKRIDPDTAEVFFLYNQILDPYGDDPDLPPECQCVGRVFFARDPVERIAVCFYDLTEDIQDRLEAKRAAADREGWLEITQGRFSGRVQPRRSQP